MKRLLLPLALAALAMPLSTTSLAHDAHTTGPTSDALIAAGENWRALYEAGDWEALRALYTDDAVLMTQGEAKIEGADNIVAFLQRLSRMGATAKFQFAPEEALIENGLGFVTATYRMDISFPSRDEPVIVVGRSLLIYKWSEDGWKLWRDMDNLAPDVSAEAFE